MTAGLPRATVVLASGNPGKLKELQELLGDLASVTDARALGIELPEETGTTFEANARLKAEAVHSATGMIAIADDSGLIVDALNGEPGVYSARYAGAQAPDEENNRKLLEAMRDVPDAQRSARFVSAIAIAFGPDDVVVTEGTCEGAIGTAPRGDGGFGYDPLFVFPDGRTMAELSPEQKNRVSHRGHAMRAAIEIIGERLTPSTNGDG